MSAPPAPLSAPSLLVLSDPHYAGDAEKTRAGYELAAIDNPLLRMGVRFLRHFLWLRDPLGHNEKLKPVLHPPFEPDCVVVNGDLSCDSAFIGVEDEAARQSARECLARLRTRFGQRLRVVPGDHELGKLSLFGGRGGMRLASLNRARDDLGIEPLWSMPLGDFDLIGVTSSLVGFPTFEPEALPAERSQWRALRTEHLEAIETTVSRIPAHRRIILFCHDPTALPFLAELPSMRRVLPRVECTFIGHLHSPLVLWKSRLLSGMPSLRFLGNSVRRMSSALNRAALWKPFHVRLCPSLAGIQLLKDGGYWEVRLGPTPTYRFHPIPWTPPRALAPGEPAP